MLWSLKMNIISTSLHQPACVALQAATPKTDGLKQRISRAVVKAMEWLRQNRHAILTASGLCLGAAILCSGEPVLLILLPLAVMNVAFGALGMIRQAVAKKMFQKNLEAVEKNFKTLNEKLPTDESDLEKYSAGILAAATAFKNGLKEQKFCAFASSFKKKIDKDEAMLLDYKNRLEKMKSDTSRQEEMKWVTNAYHDYACQTRARLLFEAEDSVKTLTKVVDTLRKRADKA